MISARVFLAGMYLHLASSVAFPAALLAAGEWNNFTWSLFLCYLAAILALQIWGWVTVAMAATALHRGSVEKLERGWRLLKLGSIPFFVLNFLYSFGVWFLIVAASRGILGILLPIPIAITCLMILQTGCVGCCWVQHLRRRPQPPGGRHYLFQLLPVADVLDTLYLLRREKRAAAPQT